MGEGKCEGLDSPCGSIEEGARGNVREQNLSFINPTLRRASKSNQRNRTKGKNMLTKQNIENSVRNTGARVCTEQQPTGSRLGRRSFLKRVGPGGSGLEPGRSRLERKAA